MRRWQSVYIYKGVPCTWLGTLAGLDQAVVPVGKTRHHLSFQVGIAARPATVIRAVNRDPRTDNSNDLNDVVMVPVIL